MKNHIALQAQSNWQAQSGNLRTYAKIGLSERGKVLGIPLIRGYRRSKHISRRTSAEKQRSNRWSACNGRGGMASSHIINGPKSHRAFTKRFRVWKETSHLWVCWSWTLSGGSSRRWDLYMMEREVRWKSHASCEAGEKLEITSKAYLWLSIYHTIILVLSKIRMNRKSGRKKNSRGRFQRQIAFEIIYSGGIW